jgi:hypothetical protein
MWVDPCRASRIASLVKPEVETKHGSGRLPSFDEVRLAVCSNLFDPALEEVLLDLAAVDTVGLSGQPHDLAELVQRRLGVRSKRGECFVLSELRLNCVNQSDLLATLHFFFLPQLKDD